MSEQDIPPKAFEIVPFDAEHFARLDAGAAALVERIGLPLKGMSVRAFASAIGFQVSLAADIDKRRGKQGRASGRRASASKIVRDVAALSKAVEEYVSQHGVVPAYLGEPHPYFSRSDAVAELDLIRRQFETECEQAEVDALTKRGFAHFVAVDLADLYERAFAQPPGYTRDVDTGDRRGPFLVFVRAIADAAGCKITDAAVEKALDRANNGKSRRSDN